MSQVNTSAARSAMVAIGFLGIVAVGFAARGTDAADAVLGAADDYGTRHQAVAQAAAADAVELGLNDDFATRNAAPAAEAVKLGPNDDFGTRNAAVESQLNASDDYGTRHSAKPAALGPNDDYGTRNAR